MGIVKKKVILPLLLLSVFIIAQIPVTCYAGTWESFTQSFGRSSVVYTNSFNVNNGGMSAYASASGYSGTVKITAQSFNSSTFGWVDSSSQVKKQGSTAIFNGSYNGTWRFKIEYDGTPSSSTATVDYFR